MFQGSRFEYDRNQFDGAAHRTVAPEVITSYAATYALEFPNAYVKLVSRHGGMSWSPINSYLVENFEDYDTDFGAEIVELYHFDARFETWSHHLPSQHLEYIGRLNSPLIVPFAGTDFPIDICFDFRSGTTAPAVVEFNKGLLLPHHTEAAWEDERILTPIAGSFDAFLDGLIHYDVLRTMLENAEADR